MQDKTSHWSIGKTKNFQLIPLMQAVFSIDMKTCYGRVLRFANHFEAENSAGLTKNFETIQEAIK